MIATCQHCQTTQELGQVWSCAKCGAPIRYTEPPKNKISNAINKALYGLPANLWAFPIIDFSKWQGDVDYQVLKGSNAIKSIIKASQSTYADSKYQRNANGLIETQQSFDLYHYFDPSYQIAPAANYFANQVIALSGNWKKLDNRTKATPYGAKFRVWLDVEDNIGPNNVALSRDAMSSSLLSFVNAFEGLTGIQLGIYTRASFWDYCVAPSPWAALRALWDAHYNQTINEPNIPNDWKNAGKTWELWQVDDKGLGTDGSVYGMQSHGIDVSYLHLNPSDAHSYAWATSTPPPDPDPEPDPVLYWATVNTATLNVRDQPSEIATTKFMQVHSGDKLPIIGQATDEQGRTWIQVSAWVAEWLTKKD